MCRERAAWRSYGRCRALEKVAVKATNEILATWWNAAVAAAYECGCGVGGVVGWQVIGELENNGS